MRTITTKENFVREFTNLLQNINQHISVLARFERISGGTTPPGLINRLNTLKLHRKKLEDMLAAYAGVSEKEWPKVRPRAQKVFATALRIHRKATRALGNDPGTPNIEK